jgi:putative tryptophan/tyrosine transport system substrate-binding protein
VCSWARRSLRGGLRQLGYVEGHNLVFDYRSADGRTERFPGLAGELVRRKVDVIVTRGTPAVQAAKNATATIPVVMAASGDPLGTGVIAGLARLADRRCYGVQHHRYPLDSMVHRLPVR